MLREAQLDGLVSSLTPVGDTGQTIVNSHREQSHSHLDTRECVGVSTWPTTTGTMGSLWPPNNGAQAAINKPVGFSLDLRCPSEWEKKTICHFP